MAAKINRTGKTYGDLTVLETILGSNSKKDTYLVKCNCCGNTMIIGIDALLKGLKCKNCRNKDRKSTYQDLIGKECNGIKVVSLAEDAIGRTGHRDIRYNCLCSCGKEFVAYRSSLLQGKVKSCGCRKHITEASKMLVDNAEAMQDYDFAKNKDIDVSMLTQGSNVVVWWKCSACGTEWQTSVYHYIQRIKPCPVCSTIDKGRTSFQEQAVAYYAKKYFPKVVIGDKKAIGKELDIYIPSIRAAIEYDGVRYHSDEKRVKNDEEKSEKCKRNGIRLIRIREYGLPEIRNSENIIRENNRGHVTLDAAIRQCLEMLGVSEPNIDTQKDSKDIYRQYKDYKAERSMGGRHPELLKEWDYELNVGVDPLMVSSSSSKVVLSGMADVVKGDTVYLLKFVSALSHRHFLQCASYMLATGLQKGVIWNIYDNKLYNVEIPDRNAFLNAVVKCVTKGVYDKVYKFVLSKDYTQNLDTILDQIMTDDSLPEFDTGGNVKEEKSQDEGISIIKQGEQYVILDAANREIVDGCAANGYDSILAACEAYVRMNKKKAEETTSKKELLSNIEDWLDNHAEFERQMARISIEINRGIGPYASYSTFSTYVVRKMLKDWGLVINFSERQLLKVWKEREKKRPKPEPTRSVEDVLQEMGFTENNTPPAEVHTPAPAAPAYRVIRSSRLSKPGDVRYIVVEEESNNVLDDANGYGYKSMQAAHKGYAYKRRNGGNFSAQPKKEKTLNLTLQGEQLTFGGV